MGLFDEIKKFIVGDAIDDGDIETLPAQIGPVSFTGKCDYIRADDGNTVIRGYGDGREHAHIRGAAPTRSRRPATRGVGFVQRTVNGKPFVSLAVKPFVGLKSSLTHRHAVQNAVAVAKHAKMIAASLRNFKASPGHAAPGRVVGAEWVDILGELDPGFDELVGSGADAVARAATYALGVRPVAHRPAMTRSRMPSPADVRRLAAALDKHADQLIQKAAVHDKATTTAQAKLVAGVKSVQKKYGFGGVKGQRVVGASGGRYFLGGRGESFYLGADESFYLGAGTPDPASPGYYTDGSLIPSQPGDTPDGNGWLRPSGAFDPAYGPPPAYGAGGSAPAPGPSGIDTSTLPPGPPDYGVGPAPTADSTLDGDGYDVKMISGEHYVEDPDPSGSQNIFYDSHGDPEQLPRGCLIYDGSQPFPISGVGSRTRFFGGAAADMGGGNSGFEFGNFAGGEHSDGHYWFWQSANNTPGIDLRYKHDDKSNWATPPYSMPGAQYDPGVDPARARAEASKLCSWGPLVGNPSQKSPRNEGIDSQPVPLWTWGLKWDQGLALWFWYWAEAPDWARAPFIAARLMKAMLDRDAQIVSAKTLYLQAVAVAQQDQQTAATQARRWGIEQTRMQNDQDRATAAAAVQQTQTDAQTAADQAALATQQQQLDLQQAQAESSAYAAWMQSPQAQQLQQDVQQSQSQNYGGTFDTSDQIDQYAEGPDAGLSQNADEAQLLQQDGRGNLDDGDPFAEVQVDDMLGNVGSSQGKDQRELAAIMGKNRR